MRRLLSTTAATLAAGTLLALTATPATAAAPVEREVSDTDQDVLISDGGTYDDPDLSFDVYQRTDINYIYAGPGETKSELLLHWNLDEDDEPDTADYERRAEIKAVDKPTAKEKKKGIKPKTYRVIVSFQARAADPFTVTLGTPNGPQTVDCDPFSENDSSNFYMYLPKNCLPKGTNQMSATFRTITEDSETGYTLSDMAQLRAIRI